MYVQCTYILTLVGTSTGDTRTKCRMGGEKGGVPPQILIGLGLSEVMGGFGTYVNPQTHLY